MRPPGIGRHTRPFRGKSVEWETPPEILAALGLFDMDGCKPGEVWDGLILPWRGRVWINPPYGPDTGKWLNRLAEHGNGIALVFARTETRMWAEHVWAKADGILFLRGRLHFYRGGKRAEGNAGGPSVLVAYGEGNVESLRKSGLPGVLLTTWILL